MEKWRYIPSMKKVNKSLRCFCIKTGEYERYEDMRRKYCGRQKRERMIIKAEELRKGTTGDGNN